MQRWAVFVDEAGTGFLIERPHNLSPRLSGWALVLSSHVFDNVGLIGLTSAIAFVSSVCEAIRSKTVVICGRELFRKKAEWSTEVVVDKSRSAIHGRGRKLWVEEVDSAGTCFFVEDPFDRCRTTRCS